MNYIGVDGCKSGWISICFDKYWNYEIGVFKNIESLCEKYKYNSMIYIDIPIGLSISKPRMCDILARKILGKRGSSVFSTPSLYAVYSENYDLARKVNIENTGKSLSKQAWNITNKIREVNTFILNNKRWFGKIREIHPELVFWSLNNKEPMRYYKKTKEGELERINILNKYYSNSEKLIEESIQIFKKDLVKDDIIDALSGAIIAKLGKINTLPEKPQVDSNGLNIEMVFYEENKDEFIKIF